MHISCSIWSISCEFCVSFLLIAISAVVLYLHPVVQKRVRLDLRQSAADSLENSTRDVSLSLIYDPSDKEGSSSDIDIIAIHGLDTRSPQTWTWVDRDNPDASVNWLQDQLMLPSKVGQARILTCNWPASLTRPSDLEQRVVEEFARSLLEVIKHQTWSNETGECRPIVFIASCLGGIILMKALVMAEGDYYPVKKATRGIVFLATPFRGTSFQDVAAWAEPGLEAWAVIRGRRITSLLRSVKGPTFDLRELVSNFTQLCTDPSHSYQLMTFYEKGKTNLYRKIFPFMSDSFGKPLVDSTSGTLDVVSHPIALDRPHKTMNKFWGPSDPDYSMVSSKIAEFLTNIRTTVDNWLCVHYYTEQRLEIVRISGETISMKHCYINLAILNRRQGNSGNLQNTKEQEGGAVEKDVTLPRSLFSRSAQLKIERPDEKDLIDLAEIFEPRQDQYLGLKSPRKILIRGRAGVGKTTLCKKIVHDFIHLRRWDTIFSRVLWIPLRKIKTLHRGHYDLKELFAHIYFQGARKKLDLSDELWRTIDTEASGSRSTLFILDGLDEITELLNPDHPASELVKELFNRPNVIVTTRPHVAYPPSLGKPDLELETIGFFPEQVNEYLETTQIDQQKVIQIQGFLRNHQLIQDLTRIPVQLDALCVIWDEGFHAGLVLETMTAVYDAIAQRLSELDARKLETEPQELSSSGVRNFLQTERKALGYLAFTGLCNNVVDFYPGNRTDMYKCLQISEPLHTFDQRLRKLSFLRTSDPEANMRNQSYHFLHLSFQEYFAALYFVQQWGLGEGSVEYLSLQAGKPEIVRSTCSHFIRKHKYMVHYDMFWRFVAGLLDKEGKVRQFVDSISDKPRDILGPTHQRLIMHCLSEIHVERSFRKELEDTLSRWLLFECRFQGTSRLAAEVEFPDSALHKALKRGSDYERLMILRSLKLRPSLPSEVIVQLMAFPLHEIAGYVKAEGLEMLSRAGTRLSNSSLKIVAACLKDGHLPIRSVSSKLLQSQATLSDGILTQVIERLGDASSDTQEAAVEILNAQSELSPRSLQAIAKHLGNAYHDVGRHSMTILRGRLSLPDDVLNLVTERLGDPTLETQELAMEVLGGQRELSPKTLLSIATRLGHEHDSAKLHAAKILESQSSLPDDALDMVMERLRDPTPMAQQLAVNVLSAQSSLPFPILQTMVVRLRDEDSDISWTATEVLASQVSLPTEILLTLSQQLEYSIPTEKELSLRAMSGVRMLPSSLVTLVASLLSHEHSGVRWAATRVLKRQRSLSSKIVEGVAQQLGNQSSDIREAALIVLRNQPALSDMTLGIAAEQLKSKSSEIRWTATKVLAGPSPSPEVFRVIERRLKDPHWRIRELTVVFLRDQNVVRSEDIVLSVLDLLRDPTSSIQEAAVAVLQKYSPLPIRAVLPMANLLKDPISQDMAVKALNHPSSLPTGLLKAMVDLLKDPTFNVQGAVLKVIEYHLRLPTVLILAIIELLDDPILQVQEAALEALKLRTVLSNETPTAGDGSEFTSNEGWKFRILSKLPQETLATLADLLEDKRVNVRKAAQKVIYGQAELPPEFLAAIVRQLGSLSHDIQETAAEVLSKQLDYDFVEMALRESWDSSPRWIEGFIVKFLGRQPRLPDVVLNSVARFLRSNLAQPIREFIEAGNLFSPDDESLMNLWLINPEHFINAAFAMEVLQPLSIFSGQRPLPQEAPKSVVDLEPDAKDVFSFESVKRNLEEPSSVVRYRTISSLRGRAVLPEGILKVTCEQLQFPEEEIREVAADILIAQDDLPNRVLLGIASPLRDLEWGAELSSLRVLRSRSNLSPEIVDIVAGLLHHWSTSTIRAALMVLHSQTQLSDRIIETLMDLIVTGILPDTCESMLRRRETLPVNVLNTLMSSLLQRPQSRVCYAAERILRGHSQVYSRLLANQYAGSMYQIFLQLSFEEHWSWYVDEENMSCVGMPDWVRQAPIDDMNTFMATITAARPSDQGLKVWDIN